MHVTKSNYLKLDLLDTNKGNLFNHLPQALKFIEDAQREEEGGGNILVHCQMGRSRSPSIIIAFIMIKHRQRAEAAIRYVRERHKNTFPNKVFLAQLIDFEACLERYFKELDEVYNFYDHIDFGLLKRVISHRVTGK
jgi:protein-tyrosine phosphatase